MTSDDTACPLRRVTPPNRRHFFFGYYDVCPWDATGRYMLSLETDFMDRPPQGGEEATVCLIDLTAGGQVHRLASTRAWHWQMGCRLQWMPNAANREIIYNDLRDGRYVSVITDIHTGHSRVLDWPIYALAPDGSEAVTLNFSRLHRMRPGYGYPGLPDTTATELAPEHDGLYRLDLHSGERALIISLAQMAGLDPRASMAQAHHWFNHLLFSPSGDRFIFLHRWRREGEGMRDHRMYTARPDGTGLHRVVDGLVSHFDWLGSNQILAWAGDQASGCHFTLFTDCSDEKRVIGEGVLTQDGHCSLSPDQRWILNDTYPQADGKRVLMVYDLWREERHDLARLYAPPQLQEQYRCDLHPRWSRDGRQVCIDSAHEGYRAMYVADVEAVIGAC